MVILRGRARLLAELLTLVRVEVRPNYLAVKMVEQFGLAEPHFWPIGCTLQTITTYLASLLKDLDNPQFRNTRFQIPVPVLQEQNIRSIFTLSLSIYRVITISITLFLLTILKIHMSFMF